MSDIKLIQIDDYYDINLLDNDLETDEGLETAIVISLFTDRRITIEELVENETDRRGWWADALNDDKDLTGSKLWLLDRQKITKNILDEAKEYCEEALQWLLDDGIAENLEVITEREGLYQMNIGIDIKRPTETINRKYEYVWRSI